MVDEERNVHTPSSSTLLPLFFTSTSTSFLPSLAMGGLTLDLRPGAGLGAFNLGMNNKTSCSVVAMFSCFAFVDGVIWELGFHHPFSLCLGLVGVSPGGVFVAQFFVFVVRYVRLCNRWQCCIRLCNLIVRGGCGGAGMPVCEALAYVEQHRAVFDVVQVKYNDEVSQFFRLVQSDCSVLGYFQGSHCFCSKHVRGVSTT